MSSTLGLDQLVSFVTKRQITAVVKTYMRNENNFLVCITLWGLEEFTVQHNFPSVSMKHPTLLWTLPPRQEWEPVLDLDTMVALKDYSTTYRKSTAHRLSCRGQVKGSKVLIFILNWRGNKRWSGNARKDTISSRVLVLACSTIKCPFGYDSKENIDVW